MRQITEGQSVKLRFTYFEVALEVSHWLHTNQLGGYRDHRRYTRSQDLNHFQSLHILVKRYNLKETKLTCWFTLLFEWENTDKSSLFHVQWHPWERSQCWMWSPADRLRLEYRVLGDHLLLSFGNFLTQVHSTEGEVMFNSSAVFPKPTWPILTS